MKVVTVSAILALCIVVTFHFLSYFLKAPDTQEHGIGSGYVFFSNSPWCPDGSKVLSGKRLMGRNLITETAYVDTEFYTVCQKD